MSNPLLKHPIVQIYPPRFPEDSLEIVGNRRGLGRLVNALIDAISVGQGSGTIYSSDGHASEVRATFLQGDRRPEEWRRSGSPYWEVDDPLVARILDLTDQNARLRTVIATLRRERKAIARVEHLDGDGSTGEDCLPENRRG